MAILAAALIDQSKLLSDKRNDAQLADTDWLTMVNWSVRSLWRLLCSLDPDCYFTQQDITLVGGSAANALFDLTTLTGTGAQAWRALHGLDFMPDTTSRRTVGRRNFQERNKGRIGWWLPTLLCTDRAYDIRGSVLNITPYEISGGPYRVYYRYAPYQFTIPADSKSLDSQLEPYSEYLAVRAAMQALGIEESDPGFLATQLGALVQEITDEHERDDEAPAVMADVEDDNGSWSWGGGVLP